MKGITFAIETILVLVLSVTVLSILLFFWLQSGNPSLEETDLIRQQNSYCSAYVLSYDPSCSGRPSDGYQNVVKQLGKVCSKLNDIRLSYPSCAGKENTDGRIDFVEPKQKCFKSLV